MGGKMMREDERGRERTREDGRGWREDLVGVSMDSKVLLRFP
jgi:hypothetical protein